MSNLQTIRLRKQGEIQPRAAIAAPAENTERLRVALVQINNSFSGQNYLPYAAGLLQAYAQRYARCPERYEFALPIYSRIPVDQAVAQLAGADVIGFSTYVWNARISLEIARRVKALRPATLIVFGGPHVPDRAEAFLRSHPYIDIVCHGEGEAVFLGLLENYPSRTWANVPSVSWLAPDGAFCSNPRAERLREISEIPSPYLGGVFAPLMRANPHERWLILWETNRGCPFQCTFCDWGSAIAAKVSQFDAERLYREIDWFAEQRIEFIFCCDANFAMLARDYELTEYVAAKKAATGYPHALSVQNTKNGTERAYRVQKLLSDAGLNKGVAIALQSVDPGTLNAIKRHNISTESFRELQRRFTRDRVETYSDLILGLPGETYESFARGVDEVIANGQHNRIQFNNLSILPNAEMGDPAYRARYGMETVETRIINIHGSLAEAREEVPEVQELVIATAAMPREDWVRARAFGWMTALLHFDKILQIPLILLHEHRGLGYRQMIEAFMDAAPERFPTLAGIRRFFDAKARDIQTGGAEYCHAADWLDIYWPADEYALIDLCARGELRRFYDEAEELLAALAGPQMPEGALHDAIALNRALVRLPLQATDLELRTAHNVWTFYRKALVGDAAILTRSPTVNRIIRSALVYRSWEQWLREVIWYGNKKGAYLYGNEAMSLHLAGHH